MKTNIFSPIQALEPYEPQGHQIKFHQNQAKYRAMVSGVGAGKTRMGVEEVRKINALYPGSLGVIGRLTSKALKETTQRRFFECIEPRLIANYNKKEEKVWLYTGKYDKYGKPLFTEVLFVHLDEPGQLGSLDISWFWIDEAHEPDGQEVPEEVFRMLTARVGRHPVGPARGWITSNSGGKDWIWKMFFSPSRNKELYWGLSVPTSANARFLPPGYEAELRANNPKTWCDRFLDASFDAFEGQIFPDFDEKEHVVSASRMKIQAQWEKGVGFDFGVSAPTAALYGAVDHEGCVWVYDEDYQADARIEKMARGIKNKGFEIVYADPSVVNRGPDKKSPKDLYEDQGVFLIPAANDIDYFLTLVTQLLRQKKLKISTRCPHLIAQIKAAAWNPATIAGTSMKEMMKKMENHALDAFKYYINTVGRNYGVLDAVSLGKKKKAHKVGRIHPSFEEDLDFHKPDYVHDSIRQKILGAGYEN